MFSFVLTDGATHIASIGSPSKKPPVGSPYKNDQLSDDTTWVSNTASGDKTPRKFEYRPLQGFDTFVCWQCKKPCYLTVNSEAETPNACPNQWGVAEWDCFKDVGRK